MTRTVKNITLVLLAAAIIGSIVYLERQKVSGALGSSGSAIDLDALHATSSTATSSVVRTPDFAERIKKYPAAIELVNPDGYINTNDQPITITSLIGKKVILLDFWTYSCINCQRVIPYLNAWYAKYKDAGLEIIALHAPEFAFEKDINNVKAAVVKYGIKYPVVMDSNHFTWNAYNNMYWPEEYLIDINGLVVNRKIGEGKYAETEREIQTLLQERKDALGDASIVIPGGLVDITQTIQTNSPETYFGSDRNEYLGNGTLGASGTQSFTRPSSTQVNTLYLSGTWNMNGEYAQNTSTDARIIYKYQSKNVYFVASAASPIQITVLRDGVPVAGFAGEDVDAEGHATISGARLYKLIAEPSIGEHTIEIIIPKAGLEAYTFTFG